VDAYCRVNQTPPPPHPTPPHVNKPRAREMLMRGNSDEAGESRKKASLNWKYYSLKCSYYYRYACTARATFIDSQSFRSGRCELIRAMIGGLGRCGFGLCSFVRLFVCFCFKFVCLFVCFVVVLHVFVFLMK